MTRSTLLISCLLSTVFAFSQKAISPGDDEHLLKPSLHIGIPVHDAGEVSSFTIGMDIRYQYFLVEFLGIGGVLGYSNYFGKDNQKDFGMIPLAGMLRYYTASKGIFFGSDLGYAWISGEINEIESGGFYIMPQAGYHDKNWNAFLYYQGLYGDHLSLGSIGLALSINLRP